MASEVLTVFLSGAIIDAMYVLWMGSVARGEILKSGMYSVGIAAPGLFGYLNVSKQVWLAAPYLAGLAVGTMLTMYWKQRREK